MHAGFALLTLFPGRVGGSETNVRGLLGEYAAGNGPERVTVLANREVADAYRGYECGPVSIHRVRSYRAGRGDATRLMAMTGAMLAPRRAARDVPGGLDVLHRPVTVPVPRLSVPTVTTLHDVQHHELPGNFGIGERLLRRAAYDRAAWASEMVVTVSEHSRERIVDLLGIEPERVEAIPHGIDSERFSPGAGAADGRLRERLALPERFLAYPANLWPHKNHERLVEGLAAARDPELELVLSGREYGRAGELHAHAERAGVGHRVHHVGYLEPDELPALLRAATAMVFPSLYEGFGLPPLEAMACGCPVACSDRGSLPEVAGPAALTFDPGSVDSIAAAIDRLASDSGLRERLRAAGLERARAYTWGAAAKRHLRVYERAVAMAA